MLFSKFLVSSYHSFKSSQVNSVNCDKSSLYEILEYCLYTDSLRGIVFLIQLNIPISEKSQGEYVESLQTSSTEIEFGVLRKKRLWHQSIISIRDVLSINMTC